MYPSPKTRNLLAPGRQFSEQSSCTKMIACAVGDRRLHELNALPPSDHDLDHRTDQITI